MFGCTFHNIYMMIKNCLFIFLVYSKVIKDVNTEPLMSRGQTDNQPIFVNNYIPASMHVMFHLTDLMKYDMKPDTSGAITGGISTTTTIRPTPPHKPGNYAPIVPPVPYTSRTDEDGIWNSWFKFGLTQSQKSGLPSDIDLFGAGPSELLHQVNTLEDEDTIGIDDDDRLNRFSVNYEDTLNVDYLRKKKVPPTRAYVTMLSLYDLLNKEAKELGLNKFNGYSETILKELIKTSSGSASDQLKFVLSKVVEKKNTRKANIINKIKTMLKDLEEPNSYLNEAIRYIPPLQFAP